MKKIVCTVLSALLFYTTSAFAVLPPMWQSVSEIETMLQSPYLKEHFSSHEPIEEIRKEESDTYVLRTRSHSVRVRVHYHPSTRPGPTQFSLSFEDVLP